MSALNLWWDKIFEKGRHTSLSLTVGVSNIEMMGEKLGDAGIFNCNQVIKAVICAPPGNTPRCTYNFVDVINLTENIRGEK